MSRQAKPSCKNSVCTADSPTVVQGFISCGSLRRVQSQEAAQQFKARLRQGATVKVKPPHWKLALQIGRCGWELELHEHRLRFKAGS